MLPLSLEDSVTSIHTTSHVIQKQTLYARECNFSRRQTHGGKPCVEQQVSWYNTPAASKGGDAISTDLSTAYSKQVVQTAARRSRVWGTLDSHNLHLTAQPKM